MNKADLIDIIAKKAELTKKDAGVALDAMMESIGASLVKGEKVTLVGFGTFDVRDRKARTGVNPQTKEKIKIPASKAPVFKAGKDLKTKVAAVKAKPAAKAKKK
jgi:DNA-binding protein HU-beta